MSILIVLMQNKLKKVSFLHLKFPPLPLECLSVGNASINHSFQGVVEQEWLDVCVSNIWFRYARSCFIVVCELYVTVAVLL